MNMSKEQVEASAFFSIQMLVAVVRNLVGAGFYDENAAIANIQETIDQGTVALGPAHHAALVEIAGTLERMVRDVSRLRREGKTEGG